MNASNRIDPTGDPARASFDQLVGDARSCRVGAGLAAIGWFHLVVFAACETLFLRGDRAAAHFLPLWTLDVAFAAWILRRRVATLVTLGSARSTRILVRIWLTFAILCLTSASLNSITGFEIDWFKISWSMLGTFGFATLAWVFHLAFLIPAVQMSLTALLIAGYPNHAYAIFGISWFLALQVLGLLLEKGSAFHRVASRSLGRDRIVIERRRSQEA